MQFVVLECIAASSIGPRLSFKGGNALRFLHLNPRSTIDLDFTADSGFPDDRAVIMDSFQPALAAGARKFGLRMRASSATRYPSDPRGTMPTWEVKVAYQLPGDRHFADFDSFSRILTVVDVEISLNDAVCETENRPVVAGDTVLVRVCTLEDILAEKLRSLLQQKPRGRHRRQDLYDIARMVRDHGAVIDRSKVADYFVKKSRARGVDPRRSAFDSEIRQRASFDYETLFDAADPNVIPLDAAWDELTAFLQSLRIDD